MTFIAHRQKLPRGWGLVRSRLICLLLLFLALSAGTALGLIWRIDLWAAEALHSYRVERLVELSGLLRVAGSFQVTALLALAIALLLWPRRRGLSIAILAAFVIVTIIEIGLKQELPHPGPRPQLGYHSAWFERHLRLAGYETPNSYPSGHVLRTAFLAWLAPLLLRRRWATAAAVMIVVMGFSVIYGGAHWLSDAAGGALLGTAGASAAVLTARTLDPPERASLRAAGPARITRD